MPLIGIWVASPLMLVAVVLGALHVEAVRAQEPDPGGYVDLHIGTEKSISGDGNVIVTVTNQGSQDAFGVKAHFDVSVGDIINVGSPSLFEQSISLDLRDFDWSTGIWNIGRLGAGESIQSFFGLKLPELAPEAVPMSLVATVSGETHLERDELLHNNTATYWAWAHAGTNSSQEEAYFNAEMEVYVDPLFPVHRARRSRSPSTCLTGQALCRF